MFFSVGVEVTSCGNTALRDIAELMYMEATVAGKRTQKTRRDVENLLFSGRETLHRSGHYETTQTSQCNKVDKDHLLAYAGWVLLRWIA